MVNSSVQACGSPRRTALSEKSQPVKARHRPTVRLLKGQQETSRACRRSAIVYFFLRDLAPGRAENPRHCNRQHWCYRWASQLHCIHDCASTRACAATLGGRHETSAPQILASSGKCRRAPRHLAHRRRAKLSDAAHPARGSFSAGWCVRRSWSPLGRKDEASARHDRC